jgi:thiol-disulfide isomerase/thioredoxin
LPPYLQVPIVPPFKIQKTDSVFYTKDSLPSKRPIVIMYFSPDCGHCQKQIKELTDSMQFVSKAFFVLAAFKQMPEIAAFEKKYKLKKFDNIRIGRDLKYFIPGFYKVKFTPFTAVYDKHGKFLKAYEFGFTIKEISELLE